MLSLPPALDRKVTSVLPRQLGQGSDTPDSPVWRVSCFTLHRICPSEARKMEVVPLLVCPSKATWVPSGDTATRLATTWASLPRLKLQPSEAPLIPFGPTSWLSWLALAPPAESPVCPFGKKEAAPWEVIPMLPLLNSTKPLPSAFTFAREDVLPR